LQRKYILEIILAKYAVTNVNELIIA
jgi:hypothetical protein